MRRLRGDGGPARRRRVAPGGPRLNACLVPAAALDGQEVITAEGLGDVGALHPVQREMADRGGSQCGYCTPGFICSMAAEYYRPDRTPAASTPASNGQQADRPRARPERLRPARHVREPVPLHRVPADPGRRLRAGRPARGRRVRPAPRGAGARRAGHRVQRRRHRVRPARRPGRGAGPAGRAPGRHGARRVHRLGRRAEHRGIPRRVRRSAVDRLPELRTFDDRRRPASTSAPR